MPLKYRLTEDRSELYRITSLINIPSKGVMEGDKGGLVSGPDNLSQLGTSWISPDAMALDSSIVRDNGWLTGQARMFGNAVLSGDAKIMERANVSGRSLVTGEAQVVGNATVVEQATITDDTFICGDAIIEGDAVVKGFVTIYGTARIGDDAVVSSERDFIVVAGIGPLSDMITMYRTKGDPRILSMFWSGTPAELNKKVSSPIVLWKDSSKTDQLRWKAQYDSIIKLSETIETGIENDNE